MKIERLYTSFCTALLLMFLMIGACFALIMPILRAPDEISHNLGGLRNYAILTKGRDAYCGFNTDLVKLSTQPDGKVSAAMLDPGPLVDRCEGHQTYGWLLTYPSVLFASAITSDRADTKLQVLFRFYMARIFNGFLVASALLFLLNLVLKYGPRSGILTLFSVCLTSIFRPCSSPRQVLSKYQIPSALCLS